MSARVRVALVGLLVAPLVGVGAMWLLVTEAAIRENGELFWPYAAVLIALGQTATVLYARRARADRRWIAAVVLAGVLATAVWAVVSAFVVLLVACRSGCMG